MKTNLLKFGLLIFALALFIVACEEGALDGIRPDQTAAEDMAKAEGTISDVFGVINSSMGNGSTYGITMKAGVCFTLDSVVTANSKKITLTYPTAGCDQGDGVIRKGQLVGMLAGKWNVPGSVLTVTFNNFSNNENTVTGTIVVKFKSANPLTFDLICTDVILTSAEGTIKLNATQTIVSMAGSATPTAVGDDIFKITGTVNLVDRENKSSTATLTDVIVDRSCSKGSLVKGFLKLVQSTGSVLEMDFGTGACDGEFTAKQGSVSITVKQ